MKDMAIFITYNLFLSKRKNYFAIKNASNFVSNSRNNSFDNGVQRYRPQANANII